MGSDAVETASIRGKRVLEFCYRVDGTSDLYPSPYKCAQADITNRFRIVLGALRPTRPDSFEMERQSFLRKSIRESSFIY